MSEKVNKENTVKDSIFDVNQIVESIKENTKNTLSDMLSEGMKKAINEAVADDEKKADYDVEKVDDKEADSEDKDDKKDAKASTEEKEESDDAPETEEPETDPASDSENADAPETEDNTDDTNSEDAGDDEWSNFDKEGLKVGDDEYDLTSLGGDTERLVSVYKKMDDSDQVIVKPIADGTEIKDNETGAEYLIKEPSTEESEEPDMGEPDTMHEGVDKEENVVEIVFGDEPSKGEKNIENIKAPVVDPKNAANCVKKGVALSTGVDPKSGLHLGQKGNMKPFATKGISESEMPDFDLDEEEEDPMEESTTVASAQARHAVKTHTSQIRKPNLPKVSKKISTSADGYEAELHEAILRKAKSLAEENMAMKKELAGYKKSLDEARKFFSVAKKALIESKMVSYNLGKVAKLFVENATTRDEKLDIISRFTKEAKNEAQANSLYESINKELKTKVPVSKAKIDENKVIAEQASQTKETVIYDNPEIARMQQLIHHSSTK